MLTGGQRRPVDGVESVPPRRGGPSCGTAPLPAAAFGCLTARRHLASAGRRAGLAPRLLSPGCENHPRSGDVVCHRRETLLSTFGSHCARFWKARCALGPQSPLRRYSAPSPRRGGRTMDSTTRPRRSVLLRLPRPGLPLFLLRPPEASVRKESSLKDFSEEGRKGS